MDYILRLPDSEDVEYLEQALGEFDFRWYDGAELKWPMRWLENKTKSTYLINTYARTVKLIDGSMIMAYDKRLIKLGELFGILVRDECCYLKGGNP